MSGVLSIVKPPSESPGGGAAAAPERVVRDPDELTERARAAEALRCHASAKPARRGLYALMIPPAAARFAPRPGFAPARTPPARPPPPAPAGGERGRPTRLRRHASCRGVLRLRRTPRRRAAGPRTRPRGAASRLPELAPRPRRGALRGRRPVRLLVRVPQRDPAPALPHAGGAQARARRGRGRGVPERESRLLAGALR